MSKKSCEAAESIEDALLRMARVNGNDLYYSRRVQHIHAPCGCDFLFHRKMRPMK